MLATHTRAIDIVFLDTGYHFPETLSFRDQLAERLNLRMVNVRSSVPKSEQRTSDGQLLFAADTDQCCYLNKVAPLEPYLQSFDVWISGVRADQSVVRANMKKTIPGPHGITRYYPMLDWSAKDIYAYCMHYDLPAHPLESQGYLSIGCMPCTRPYLDALGDDAATPDRGGRWSGRPRRSVDCTRSLPIKGRRADACAGHRRCRVCGIECRPRARSA
ncbi:phosphoadenylyl-sulfate reductase [Spiribacter pallidus]|uniref:phosphoadenylyl-sulfate reductase n=1 Tax=Spiribacter pallidus TaxID=1987936 RepID=UPI0034A022A2